jgi:hypothetical protein
MREIIPVTGSIWTDLLVILVGIVILFLLGSRDEVDGNMFNFLMVKHFLEKVGKKDE